MVQEWQTLEYRVLRIEKEAQEIKRALNKIKIREKKINLDELIKSINNKITEDIQFDALLSENRGRVIEAKP